MLQSSPIVRKHRFTGMLLLAAALLPWLYGVAALGALGGMVIYKENSFDPDSVAEIANYSSVEHFSSVDNVVTTDGQTLRITSGQEPVYLPQAGDPDSTPQEAARTILAAERRFSQFARKLEIVRLAWAVLPRAAPVVQSNPEVSIATVPQPTPAAEPGYVLRTKSGEVYQSWSVIRIDGDTLVISHVDGISRISITDLPDDLSGFPREIVARAQQLRQQAASAKKIEIQTGSETPTLNTDLAAQAAEHVPSDQPVFPSVPGVAATPQAAKQAEQPMLSSVTAADASTETPAPSQEEEQKRAATAIEKQADVKRQEDLQKASQQAKEQKLIEVEQQTYQRAEQEFERFVARERVHYWKLFGASLLVPLILVIITVLTKKIKSRLDIDGSKEQENSISTAAWQPIMDIDEWYYSDGENSIGPLIPDSLRALHTAGVINGNTLICRSGSEEWASLTDTVRPSQDSETRLQFSTPFLKGGQIYLFIANGSLIMGIALLVLPLIWFPVAVWVMAPAMFIAAIRARSEFHAGFPENDQAQLLKKQRSLLSLVNYILLTCPIFAMALDQKIRRSLDER